MPTSAPVRLYRVEYELAFEPGYKFYFLRTDTVAGCLASARRELSVGKVLRVAPVDVLPDWCGGKSGRPVKMTGTDLAAATPAAITGAARA